MTSVDSVDSVPLLCFDHLRYISLLSIDSYRAMINIPSVGKWSLTSQIFIQRHFSVVEVNNIGKITKLCGNPHKLDGPAFEDNDGRKEWYQNGKLHRIDGPAIEYHIR